MVGDRGTRRTVGVSEASWARQHVTCTLATAQWHAADARASTSAAPYKRHTRGHMNRATHPNFGYRRQALRGDATKPIPRRLLRLLIQVQRVAHELEANAEVVKLRRLARDGERHGTRAARHGASTVVGRIGPARCPGHTRLLCYARAHPPHERAAGRCRVTSTAACGLVSCVTGSWRRRVDRGSTLLSVRSHPRL